MAIRTELAELIGVEHPIMQAGMGGIGHITLATLAASISNAGGLGTIAHPAVLLEEPGRSASDLDEQVARTVRQVLDGIRTAVALTDRPLAINVRIAREQPDAPAVLRAILDERRSDKKTAEQLRVLTTSGGHPYMYGMNEEFRAAGMLHFHAISNVRQALTAQAEGVDGVIATGFEAAGHIGSEPVHSFVLVPSVVAAVEIPVLCAGGIVDGVSLAAALTMGAQMGYIGTRFLASVECDYHENIKRAIVRSAETDTAVIPAWFGPGRFLRNSVTDAIGAMASSGASNQERMRFEGEAVMRGAIDGDMERGFMIGGQGVGRVDAVLPSAEIVRQISTEAALVLRRSSQLVTTDQM